MKRFKLIIQSSKGETLSIPLFSTQADAIRYYLNQLRYRMENPTILRPISGRIVDLWSGREVWRATTAPEPEGYEAEYQAAEQYAAGAYERSRGIVER